MKLVLTFVFLTIYIAVQFYNKNIRNIFFVDLNTYWYLITFTTILLIHTIQNNNIYFNCIIIILICIIAHLLSCRIIINNRDILTYGFFKQNRLIKIDDIQKIVLTDENSQFFINFILKDGSIKKIPLIFVSPINLIKEVINYNPLIEVNVNLIEKKIKLRKVFFMISDLILLTIFIGIVIYNTPIR